jgi:ribosomal protein L37AE/L43A
MSMDKYGVVTDEPEKTAEVNDEDQRCPNCERVVYLRDPKTNVPRCAACGTKPFEGSPPSSSSSP